MQDVQEVKIETKEFIPEYGTERSAGFDIKGYLPDVNHLGLPLAVGETKIIPTGIRVDIPDGYEIQLRSRSGLTARNGIIIAQGLATIDEDFTGEIGIILRNEGREPFYITHGMKLCQGVLAPVTKAIFKVVPKLNKDTKRGSGAYGSTGV